MRSVIFVLAIILFPILFWFTSILIVLFLLGVAPLEKLPLEWDQYWYGIFGALVGAVLALIGNHLLSIRKRNKAGVELQRIIETNIWLCSEILRWLNQGAPNFKLDTVALSIWLTEAGDVFDIVEKKRISDFRYQLEHLNTKLEIYYPVFWPNVGISASSTTTGALRRSLNLDRHLRETRDMGEKLLLQVFRGRHLD
jgi:hypothetical protein